MKQEKKFLFHFESSFRSLDNQILTFQAFKCHDIIKCLSMKHETHFTEQLEKQAQSGNETLLLYIISQNKIFDQNILRKMWPRKEFQASSVKWNLRWAM